MICLIKSRDSQNTMRIPGFCSTYEVHRQHGFNKSVATVYANRMRSRKKSFRFKKLEKKEARTEGVASAPIVYSFLKNETKVFLTFVPHSFDVYRSIFMTYLYYATSSYFYLLGTYPVVDILHNVGFLPYNDTYQKKSRYGVFSPTSLLVFFS